MVHCPNKKKVQNSLVRFAHSFILTLKIDFYIYDK